VSQTLTNSPPTPAHAYQEYFGPAIFEPLLEQVLECESPAPGERVLDVACGTGIVTRRVASVVGPRGQVVGVDVNPVMLEVARSIPVPDGAAIEWRRGDGTALDLPDEAFDVAYCQQGLQFFPDRLAGVRELRRVLREGGPAVIATWQGLDRHPLYAALADAEEPHLGALGVDISREELEAPFSLGDEELTHLLDDAGFVDIQVVERSIRARFATPDRFVERMEFAYAAVIPQFVEDPAAFERYLAAISRDTSKIVERYRDGDHVVVPMHANIAVAVR
jgi:SAM-dependent methyltransferase